MWPGVEINQGEENDKAAAMILVKKQNKAKQKQKQNQPVAYQTSTSEDGGDRSAPGCERKDRVSGQGVEGIRREKGLKRRLRIRKDKDTDQGQAPGENQLQSGPHQEVN